MGPNNAGGKEDPSRTVIIVGDDGKYYRLTNDIWEKKQYILTNPDGIGTINQLTEFGSYLSYVPPDKAVGIGEVCAVVNLQLMLKNNVSAKVVKK